MADHPDQLGNYRLICLLGEGGFANVYLGQHIYLNTQAAIKVLQVHLGFEESEDFLDEARMVARLVHPHIVRVLEFGVEGHTPFLVMDYAPNGTLRQRHPRGTQLSLDTIVSYVKQVAAALQYAHDRKLIHRDVKPENMLLGGNDDILLSDFGIALVAQTSRSLQPNIEETAGTLAYMAPEQLAGKPRPASDQYALGVVAYEWLTGERPFQGTFTEIASQHMFAPPAPLHEKVPGIPLTVEQVLMKAMEKDPHQRFASVQLFASALEQACLHEPLLPFVPSPEPQSSQSNSEDPSLHQFHILPTAQKIPSQVLTSTADHDPPPTIIRGATPVLSIPVLSPTSSQSSVSDTATIPLAHTPLPHQIVPESETSSQDGDSDDKSGSYATLQVPSQRDATPATEAITRRSMILGLAGLVGLTVVGGSVGFLVQHFHMPSHSHMSTPTATSAQTPIVNPTATSTVQPAQTPTATPTQQPTPTPSPTPNPTPTPTATPTPSPTPTSTSVSIISAGITVLHANKSFDFNQGLEIVSGGDVYWDLQSDPTRTLDPVGNAQLANLGAVDFNSLDLATLQSESYSTTPLDGNNDSTNQLVNNDVFAVLTNSGNHAKVLIVNYGDDLQIQWATYQG